MCGLRTRPRMDADPPRVELPSAGGGLSSRRPRSDNLSWSTFAFISIPLQLKVIFKTYCFAWHYHPGVCVSTAPHRLDNWTSVDTWYDQKTHHVLSAILPSLVTHDEGDLTQTTYGILASETRVNNGSMGHGSMHFHPWSTCIFTGSM